MRMLKLIRLTMATERWASGRMDHVHKKRVETMRRRREEEAKLAESGASKASSFQETPIYPPKYSLSQPTAPGVSQVGDPTAQEQSQSLSTSDSSFAESESDPSVESDYGSLHTENINLEPTALTPTTLSGVLGKVKSAGGEGDEKEEQVSNNGVGSHEGAPSATPTDITGREGNIIVPGHLYTKWRGWSQLFL